MRNVFKFQYKGYTFIPLGQISPEMSLKRAALYLRSNTIGLCAYDKEGTKGWSYNDFYKAATPKCDICDVFYCEEARKNYIPCNNELMEWSGDYTKIHVE